jgi:hypothetical protein
MIVCKNCPTVGLLYTSRKLGEMATGAAKPCGAGRVGPRPRRGTTHIVFTPHDPVEIKGLPTEQDLQAIDRLAATIYEKHAGL